MSEQPATKQPWVTPELHIEPGTLTAGGPGASSDGPTDFTASITTSPI